MFLVLFSEGAHLIGKTAKFRIKITSSLKINSLININLLVKRENFQDIMKNNKLQ